MLVQVAPWVERSHANAHAGSRECVLQEMVLARSAEVDKN
jgi:hypothetical protein